MLELVSGQSQQARAEFYSMMRGISLYSLEEQDRRNFLLRILSIDISR